MLSFPVIKVHDVLIDGPFCLFTAFKLHPPYQFGLQGLEEGFYDSIEAPIFVKRRFGLVSGRTVGRKFRERCSV